MGSKDEISQNDFEVTCSTQGSTNWLPGRPGQPEIGAGQIEDFGSYLFRDTLLLTKLIKICVIYINYFNRVIK